MTKKRHASGHELFVISIDRHEVERCDPEPVLAVVHDLFVTPDDWHRWRGRVALVFHGWEDDPRDLYVIPEVRAYMAAFDARFPAWTWIVPAGALLVTFVMCVLPHVTSSAPGAIDFDVDELTAFMWRAFDAVNVVDAQIGLRDADVSCTFG